MKVDQYLNTLIAEGIFEPGTTKVYLSASVEQPDIIWDTMQQVGSGNPQTTNARGLGQAKDYLLQQTQKNVITSGSGELRITADPSRTGQTPANADVAVLWEGKSQDGEDQIFRFDTLQMTRDMHAFVFGGGAQQQQGGKS